VRVRCALSSVALLLVAFGCATRVLVPPRVDLGQWDTIGIVDFGSGGDPALGRLATSQFVQMLQDAQPGVRILELGPEQRILADLGRDTLDFEAVRALGERFPVDALFTGALELGDVRPSVRLGRELASVRAAADVNGRLATKLLETRSGAVVWSRSAQASANVARVGVRSDGSVPSVRVGDPEDARAGLVPHLVAGLGSDFYPSWQNQ
jgi:hypothetical protein